MRTLETIWLVGCLALVGCPDRTRTQTTTAGYVSPGDGEPLALGAETELTQDRAYVVDGVRLKVRRVAMAIGRDKDGHDTEWLDVSLVLESKGRPPIDLDLTGSEPGDALGLVFRANALGYQWGKTPATVRLRVDRK